MRRGTAALFALFALAASARAEPLPPGAAAMVDDQVVTQYDVDQRVALMRALYGKPDTAELRQEVLEKLKSEARYLKAAQGRNVTVSSAEVDRTVDSILRANHITAARLAAVLAHYDTAIDGLRTWIAVRLAWAKATRRPDDWNYVFPGLSGPSGARQPNPRYIP
jgi:peptidyl-prolyl cis-trans isomerase SurA